MSVKRRKKPMRKPSVPTGKPYGSMPEPRSTESSPPTNASPNHSNPSVSVQRTLVESYSGSLPPPQIMAWWEESVPGFTKRYADGFFGQTQHRQRLEIRTVSHGIWQSWAGWATATVLNLGALTLAAYMTYLGHPGYAVTLVTGVLGPTAGAFVFGRLQKRKGLKERAEIESRS